MGLGDAISGLLGFTEKERREKDAQLAKTQYAAKQKELDLLKDAAEKKEEMQREMDEKIAEANREKEEETRRAFEEKSTLEGQLRNQMSDSHQQQMTMMMANNEAQRAADRENEERRRIIEQNARDNEQKLRAETERKLENERLERMQREDRVNKEKADAISAASKALMDSKDQANAHIHQLVADNQKSRDQMSKDFMADVAQKEAANAEKVEKLRMEHQQQLASSNEQATNRENQLRDERNKLEDKYKSDMAKKDELSAQEREKISTEYKKKVENLDKAIADNYKASSDRIDALNKAHHADVREAHEQMRKDRDAHAAEIKEMNRLKEEEMRSNSEKNTALYNKMLDMKDQHASQIMLLGKQAVYSEAKSLQNATEYLMIHKAEKELAPIKEIRQQMLKDASRGSELFSNLTDDDTTKREIITAAQGVKRALDDLLIKLGACESLGDKQGIWKAALLTLVEQVGKYEKAVRRDILKATTTQERIEELEDDCDKVKAAVLALPEMTLGSLEYAMSQHAKQSLTHSEDAGVKAAIADAAHAANKEQQ